jgi:hypothetical protein
MAEMFRGHRIMANLAPSIAESLIQWSFGGHVTLVRRGPSLKAPFVISESRMS